MSIADEIDRLRTKRTELQKAIDAIDAELGEARDAIGGVRTATTVRTRPGEVRRAGSIANEIYAALESGEPRTIDQLVLITKRSKPAISTHLKRMREAGRVHVLRLEGLGRPMIVARTKEALQASQPSPQADDELGQGVNGSSPTASGGALTLPGTDGLQ